MTIEKNSLLWPSLIVIITFMPAPASAQEQAELTAASILDRYVEALGGEMALQSLEGVEYVGEIDSGGFPGTFVFLYVGGKCKMTINVSGQPAVHAGFDGEYIWQQRGTLGFKQPSDRFVGLGVDLPGTPMTTLEWLEQKDQSILLEPARVGERSAHVISFEGPEGQTVKGFFDQESGLLIQAIYITDAGATEYRLEYADEPIEGLIFVNKATSSIGGTTRFIWTVTNIVANPELDGSEFQIPDGLIEGEPGGG